MIKYLDAETVKKELDGISNIHPGIISAIKSIIDDIPAENVEEIKYAKWIMERGPDGKPYCCHCSNCDLDFHRIEITTGYDRCPYCGAYMDTTKIYEVKEYNKIHD